MKVAAVVEREDGGADVVLEAITPVELQALLQAGFVALLNRQIENDEAKRKVPAILRGNEE